MNEMAAEGWRVIEIIHGEHTLDGDIVFEREIKK